MPEPLRGAVRRYDWGSPSFIPGLLGLPADGEPWAELWLGAHPTAPATVGARAEPLDRLVEADPAGALGPSVARRFGELPFLAKVLAAVRPLSLQAHPDAELAQAGFEREQSLGIALDSPGRCFRDRSHKPELICALDDFEALCGVRDPAATLELLDVVDTPALDPVRTRLRDDATARGLKRLIGWLLRLERAEAAALIEPVADACAKAAAAGGGGAATAPARAPQQPPAARTRVPRPRGPLAARTRVPRGPLAAAAELGARYPDDPAVIVSLLLNHVALSAGEALFSPPGTLHCYLRGAVLEVMACSDNVLRAGLTSKHVDVGTLLQALDAAPGPADVQRPEPVDGVTVYSAPAEEFLLLRADVDAGRPARLPGGPAVLLCAEGRARANGLALARGQAAWVGAAEPSIELKGRAAVFRVGVGDSAAA